jgi:hypothetical protein
MITNAQLAPYGAQISQVALNALKFYPEPNVPGATVNNFYATGGSPTATTAWDVRVDHTIDDKQKIFVRYSNRVYQSNPDPLWPTQSAVAEGLIDGDDYSRGLTAAYTLLPKSNMIFDTRLGFARTLYLYQNTSLRFNEASQLGLPADINQFSGTPLFPVFSPQAYTNLGNNSYRHNAFMTYSLLSSLTWTHGQHTFKFGFDGRMLRVNDRETSDSSGNFKGDVWIKAEGGAAELFIRNPARRKELVPKLKAYFESLPGIQNAYTNDEARAFGIPAESNSDQAPQLYLTAAPDYAFSDDLSGPLTRQHAPLGAHGYPNTMSDMQALFVASGAAVVPGVTLGPISNLQVAPTIAKILSVSLPDAKQPALDEILR